MPFKEYSPKQKKLAKVAKPRNKITAADFKKLQKQKKSAVTRKRAKAQGVGGKPTNVKTIV